MPSFTWEDVPDSYSAVDVTPAELRNPSLCDWAVDKQAYPVIIDNWHERRAMSLVPFKTRGGWPLNPMGPTGRVGRNLPRWGENAAADTIVQCSGHYLFIKRGDTGEWALPGGMIDDHEPPNRAALRELHEETGIVLPVGALRHLAFIGSLMVEDPRATDHAWVATALFLLALDGGGDLPEVRGADDATDARWWRGDSLAELLTAMHAEGERMYPAHVGLLSGYLVAGNTPTAYRGLRTSGLPVL